MPIHCDLFLLYRQSHRSILLNNDHNTNGSTAKHRHSQRPLHLPTFWQGHAHYLYNQTEDARTSFLRTCIPLSAPGIRMPRSLSFWVGGRSSCFGSTRKRTAGLRAVITNPARIVYSIATTRSGQNHDDGAVPQRASITLQKCLLRKERTERCPYISSLGYSLEHGKSFDPATFSAIVESSDTVPSGKSTRAFTPALDWSAAHGYLSRSFG
jgi:hypothetical protein